MKENKEDILKNFTETLKKTRAWQDLQEIKYTIQKEREYALIILENKCCYKADITGDSGMAMIEDIVKTLATHY